MPKKKNKNKTTIQPANYLFFLVQTLNYFSQFQEQIKNSCISKDLAL